MSRKAVDVVLLPGEAMADKAIEANAELVKKFGGKIVLNKEDCQPHISLAMGCVYEKDIGDIGKILKAIAKRSCLGDLRVIGAAVTVNSAGEKVSAFEVEKTEELQRLHQEIMEKLEPYLSYEVRADMMADAIVDESALAWVREYRAKSSFANFSPHITIGYGQMGELPLPMEFGVSKVALCHLGNHCTCRKVLASAEL